MCQGFCKVGFVVILSAAKNLYQERETLRCAQGDKLAGSGRSCQPTVQQPQGMCGQDPL